MRSCEHHEVSQLNELKIDMAALNMIAGWTANGDTIMVEQMPIFGGYTGGVEETAICDVATTLSSFALFSGNFHLDGPIHIRWGITTARETAAQAMSDTASGRELLSGSAAAKGVVQDYTTGMEARIMGEAAMATAGMKVSKVNEIIEALVSSYEKDYAKAPKGKSFRECYNVQTVRPTDEYLKVYDGAVAKLRELGLEIR